MQADGRCEECIYTEQIREPRLPEFGLLIEEMSTGPQRMLLGSLRSENCYFLLSSSVP